MVTILPQKKSFWGEFGSGLGQGLSEQIPKEMDRRRLSEGLQKFEQESANLTPMQQLARLSSIPGITPQMIQTFGELAQRQSRANALDNQDNSRTQTPSPFPSAIDKSGEIGTESPSITKEKPLEQIQQGFIPRTKAEKLAAAGKRYNENPALFGHDPQKAIEYEDEVDRTNQEINLAYQKQHENLTNIQDNVVKRLNDQSQRLGVDIPSNVYSKIEDKAIQATKPKSEGGEGLTEQQAMKKYGNELDEVSRDYSSLDSIGDWSITGRSAKDTLNMINSLQKKFRNRKDTENMADMLIAKSGLSPQFAYSLAQPVKDVKDLNHELSKLPSIKPQLTAGGGLLGIDYSKKRDSKNKTLEISKKIAPLLNKDGSPLAVGYELEKKGYDPEVWYDYLIKNSDELGLTGPQIRQLEKHQGPFQRLNDWWLSIWSGIEKTGEKK